MSFQLDREYLTLAEANTLKGFAASKRQGVWVFVFAVAVLLGWLTFADVSGVSEKTDICVTIALSALCIVYSINTRAATTEADIVHNSGAIEFFGQSILAELVRSRTTN